MSRINYFKITQIYHNLKKNPRKYLLKYFKTINEEGLFNSVSNKLFYRSKVLNNINKINNDYQIWLKKHYPSTTELTRERKTIFQFQPLISIIIPTYNSNILYLKKCLDSVLKQSYQHWELCLADDCSTDQSVRETILVYAQHDPRIKYVFRETNGHISLCSNSALAISKGEFICLLDHDDELFPNALFEIVKLLNKDRHLDLIYTDEDKIEENGRHVDPFFKPDWSPDMFLSVNYLCHLTAIRRSLVKQIGGFRPGFEGSQDYDLFLRVTELTENIAHLPKILYSWRKTPGSTAAVYEAKSYADQASIRALTEALKRRKIKGQVTDGLVSGTFRVRYDLYRQPLVSIILPTKNQYKYVKKCLKSVLEKTKYPNYELVIIDTGSNDKKVWRFYEAIKREHEETQILTWNKPFNFSAVCNWGAAKSKGQYYLFLNNDTEVVTPDWIENMLEHAQRKEVGAVGVKLLYPNKTIQHAGVVLGIIGEHNRRKKGVAGHVLKYFPDVPLRNSLLNSKDIIRNYSAVTGACLMVKKEKFFEVGGLDEKFRIAFNDVDFCLKLGAKGYLNVYTPYSRLYHYESISVGKPEKLTRNIKEFKKEQRLMVKKYGTILINDPFYNQNLTLFDEDLSIKI